MKIRVLLAEGRKIVREALGLLLEQHDGIDVVGEAADAPAAVKLVKALPVHVVVLNLTAPTAGGPEAVKSLLRARRERPVRVIALTLNPDATFVRGLLEAGAAGVLAKDAAGDELVRAIRSVHAGAVYLSPGLVDAVVGGYVRTMTGAATERALAPRERVILEHIASGESTKETAAALGVSTKTVETLRRRIMQKLDRHSVAELTKYAVMQGLTPLERSV
jgi:DNA-binding NarL/FixJ family response regulator